MTAISALGVLASAAGTASSASQAAAGRRNQRNAAALNSLGGASGPGGFQPTALSAAAAGQRSPDDMGLAAFLNQQEQPQEQPPQPSETPNPEGMFSPDAKPDPITGAKPANDSATVDAAAGMQGKDYLNLASSLSGLAAQLAQPLPGPPGAPIPQPGPMNFQPTALAQLARRRF